jgi:hypothetical protein
MNKRILFAGILALVVLVAIVAPASATRPEDVSGQYTFMYGMPEMRPAGRNCIIEVDGTYPFTGDLEGEAIVHFWVVSHGSCENAYPFAYPETLWAKGTFTGEVLGQSGTFDFVYTGRTWPAEPGELALDARIVVLSGTDELSNLEGVLQVAYVMGDSFDTYSGHMHFGH